MKTTEIDGVPVRDVPPDFWVQTPRQDEQATPVLAWWARHANGRLTPIYRGQVTPGGVVR